MDEIKTHTSATERINFTIWRNSSTHPFSDVLFADVVVVVVVAVLLNGHRMTIARNHTTL